MDQLSTMGPPYDYFPNASKRWLVKKCYLDHAKSLFADTVVSMSLWIEGHILDQLLDLLLICFWENYYLGLRTTNAIFFCPMQLNCAAFTHGLISKC